MEEKINKLNEQEAKQLLIQLTELLKENDLKMYDALVMTIEMSVLSK